MKKRASGVLVGVLGVVGLSFEARLAAAAPVATPTPAEDASSPPKLRLPGTASPTAYSAELWIVPTEDSFRGTVDIAVRFPEKTQLLWLNATDLTVSRATAAFGKQEVAVKPLPGGKDFLGLSFDRPVGPGTGRLTIEYTGVLNKTDTAGLFKQKDGVDWYVYSQFEATDARRAFPCFDEPSFKVPWQLTLHIPKGNTALSNTPVVSEADASAGTTIVRFAKTLPLPSYLIALGVGPFEFVDAGKAGRKKTPVRIVTPKGKSARARYAAETTRPVLELLERYFGTPYPYEKLDQLAIPVTVGFGAMENPGLITWAESILLATPEEETVGWKRSFAGINAHEIAHQWFGNLVTMAWWDDIWLNESFADWMAQKTLIQWKPEWEPEVSRANSKASAMESDSLVTARKIRQPIESPHDIANAFDNISYAKGAAVLTMFEAWMGEKKLQEGVRRYISAHAFKNASAADFLKALEADSPGVSQAFSTFLEQPGVPLLSVELSCGSNAQASLQLAQKRFLPAGSSGSPNQTWKIPVCVRARAGDSEKRACTLVSEATREFPLPPLGKCPDWILANDGPNGYYRTLYGGDLLARLLADGGRRLTLPERVGVLRDVNALAAGGAIPRGDALALVPVFAKDPSRHIVSATVSIAAGVTDHLVSDGLRPKYARFIQAMYGERARTLGFLPRPEDDDDTRLLRQSLLGVVAIDGEDAKLQQEAGSLALRWLEDPKAVDAAMVATVLKVAAWNGDRGLFEHFLAEAKKTKERRDRQRLLSALGSFRDPALEKEALRLFLTDQFDPREARALFFAGLAVPSSRQLVFDFVKENFDAIVAKLPRDYGAFLPVTGSSFCDEAHRVDVGAFFKDRVTKFLGGPRNLARTLEGVSLCIAQKEAQQAKVAAFLEKY